MTEKTRYKYEKRIKELQTEVNRLEPYRSTAIVIYNAMVSCSDDNTYMETSWVLKQFSWLLK